jgi:hypothetical protein
MNIDDRESTQVTSLAYTKTNWRPGTLLVEGEYSGKHRLLGRLEGRWKLYSLNDENLSFILEAGAKQYRFSLVQPIRSILVRELGAEIEIGT